ncbi:PAS domain S-box protein [Lacunisphaera limnophila]|nr:PAS domain S-box protein [Lacunisphaera limnophila]
MPSRETTGSSPPSPATHIGWLANWARFVRAPEHRQRLQLLAGMLLLGTVPLIVASFILPVRVKSTLTAAGHERLTQVARYLATFTEAEMQRHLDTVRSLARVESLADGIQQHRAGTLDAAGLAAVKRQLSALLQGLSATQYQGLFLGGPDGFLFAGGLRARDDDPYAGLHVRDRRYFTAVRDTLQPVISNPIISKVDNVPIIVVAVPVLDDRGAFAGFVGLSIEIKPLAAMISSQKLGESGYPFAIDREGVLLAHPDAARILRLNLRTLPGATRLAERMLRGETGIEAYESSTGATKLAAFAPVPVAGWSVAASIETAEFDIPAQRIRRILFAMTAACLVIAAGLALAFSLGLDQLNRALTDARASEARFRQFASVTNEAIWDWDLTSGELWWNEGLSTHFGYSPAELRTGLDALQALALPPEQESIRDGLDRCRQTGTWSGEHHLRRRDGTLVYVLHRAVAVRDGQGRILRIIGSMSDISERRAAEKKLQEQAALIDESRDAIMVCSLDQHVLFWSRGAERLYGWSSTEAVGRRVDELLRLDRPAFAEAGRTVFEQGAWVGRLQHSNRLGDALTVDCRWTLLSDEQGRPRSILTIGTDITERTLMEAKFLRAQRLESIGTLAGGISHDLNNLLAPIVMGVGMLNQTARNADDRSIISVIEQSAARAANLVKQVLSFARGIDGAKVSVHLGYVAREVETMIRSTFPKNITLRFDVPKDLWLVTADPTQLGQVLLNLCVNARDALPAGGQLTVTARNVRLDTHFSLLNREITPGPHVLLEVADTGTGIPQDIVDKIFEPFFTTKAPGKGTGLGLSTVIGITRSHGGTINVYTEPGKGSVFKVYLPAAHDATEAPAAETIAAPARGQGELILVVDDEDMIRTVTQGTLESSGYQVLVAADGAEAFALYHQHRHQIALVLTDMMMPVMDGHALIGALRRINPGVRLVAASGLNDNNNQIKAAQDQIQFFLCKPYTATALLTTIRDALASPPPGIV